MIYPDDITYEKETWSEHWDEETEDHVLYGAYIYDPYNIARDKELGKQYE